MGVSVGTNGKGSGRRPTQVDKSTYDTNWETIFGKKNKDQQSNQCEGCEHCTCQKDDKSK